MDVGLPELTNSFKDFLDDLGRGPPDMLLDDVKGTPLVKQFTPYPLVQFPGSTSA